MYKDNQNKGPAMPARTAKRQYISGNTIAAAVGAIIMFISFAFPWYAIRFQDYDTNIAWDMNITYLITDTTNWWSLWVGSALPVIGIIILASTILLFAVYSLLKGTENTYLWGRLGILSGIFIIINALYIFFWMRNHFGEWMNILDTGAVIAFVGAIIITLSHPGFRKKSL
ncbi:hypothetical protein ACFLTQ_00050 [Chloroflexota bacterium]